LEVKAALVPLLLSPEDPFDDPLLAARHVQALLAALTARGADGFTAAFGSFLSCVPFSIHLAYEAYYQTVFLLALRAPRPRGRRAVRRASEGGDGRRFHRRDKIRPAEGFWPSPDDADGKDARIKKGLENLAAKAMAQIETNKYSKKFQRTGSRILKTALVISERTDVIIFFEEAKNFSQESRQTL
jgi:hypothetical protein